MIILHRNKNVWQALHRYGISALWSNAETHNNLLDNKSTYTLSFYLWIQPSFGSSSFFSSLCSAFLFLRNKYKLRAPGWLSQLSIWLLISVQVMISQFMRSSPESGSTLTELSLLEILSLSLSLSLSLCPSPASLSQNKETLKKRKKRKISQYKFKTKKPSYLVNGCIIWTSYFTP